MQPCNTSTQNYYSLIRWSPLIFSCSYWEHELTPMSPLMMQVASMPLSLVWTQTLLISCSTWWTKLLFFQKSEPVVIVNHTCIKDCEEWREELASFPGLHSTNAVVMDIEGLVKLLRRWCRVDVWGHGISGLCQGTLQQLAHNDWKIDIKQSWWRSSCSESHLTATHYAKVWSKELELRFKHLYTFSYAALTYVTRSLWVLLRYSYGWLSERKEHHQGCSIGPSSDCKCATSLLQCSFAKTRSATSPDAHLTSFYIEVLPGLPQR